MDCTICKSDFRLQSGKLDIFIHLIQHHHQVQSSILTLKRRTLKISIYANDLKLLHLIIIKIGLWRFKEVLRNSMWLFISTERRIMNWLEFGRNRTFKNPHIIHSSRMYASDSWSVKQQKNHLHDTYHSIKHKFDIYRCKGWEKPPKHKKSFPWLVQITIAIGFTHLKGLPLTCRSHSWIKQSFTETSESSREI